MTIAGIDVDLDALLEQALRGVRRASVFLGLGINAAVDPNFRRYQLTGVTNIQLLPDALPEDRIDHFKEEFRLWIEAGGFRELVESFASYLDGIHHVCMLMAASTSAQAATDLQERQSRFAGQGVPNKLNILSQNYGVTPAHTSHLVSLGKARNCLTHRRGIVGPEDVGAGTSLRVTWLGADMFVEEPNGNRIPFEHDTPPIFLPDGGTVCMQMIGRERDFNLGQKLLLTARDLAEICWFYTREAGSLRQSLIQFAERSGIRIQQRQT